MSRHALPAAAFCETLGALKFGLGDKPLTTPVSFRFQYATKVD